MVFEKLKIPSKAYCVVCRSEIYKSGGRRALIDHIKGNDHQAKISSGNKNFRLPGMIDTSSSQCAIETYSQLTWGGEGGWGRGGSTSAMSKWTFTLNFSITILHLQLVILKFTGNYYGSTADYRLELARRFLFFLFFTAGFQPSTPASSSSSEQAKVFSISVVLAFDF